jgi:hypothetical protein
VWSAATLAPSFGALEADVAAQLAPMRGIKRSQLRADWHRYAVSWDYRRMSCHQPRNRAPLADALMRTSGNAANDGRTQHVGRN